MLVLIAKVCYFLFGGKWTLKPIHLLPIFD